MRYDRKLADYLKSKGIVPGVDCDLRDDGSGPWIESWGKKLGKRPSPEQVAAWQPSPVARVAADLGGREIAAATAITTLKAAVACAMVEFAGFSEHSANAEGSALVVAHAPLIQGYILAGGNQVAGRVLLEAILTEGREWLAVSLGPDGPKIQTLFELALS